MRWVNGLEDLTRQIWLNARSIVSSIATAVTISATAPTADSRVALVANWLRLPSMVLAIVFGIRLWMKYASSDVRKVLNSGKVVNTASAIVSSGTSASTVVKVRL